ncbi:MAG: hypothetical protein IKR23_08680 [Lachnospiraceae bacterium]|nr:hypothetical protein [Lachnospiraceae bacterium]
MKISLPDIKNIKNLLPAILLLLAFSFAAELIVFNFRSITTLGNESLELGDGFVIHGPAEVETPHAYPDRSIDNLLIENVTIEGAASVTAHVELSDKGNAYVYPISDFTMVPGVPMSGYCDIYSYGDVHEIYVWLSVPEGVTVTLGKVSFNVHRPFQIKPLRLLLLFAAFLFVYLSWSKYSAAEINGRDPIQLIIIALSVIFLIRLSYTLSFSNEELVNDPPSHHAQYQELAQALDEGHVSLDHLQAHPDLLAKENPYDTLALLAEGVPFKMDYAYYEGKYYVYFGIIPELLFYYPWYKIHGEAPTNCDASWRFASLLVIGSFLLIWELIKRFKRGSFPFWLYLLMSYSFCLYANYVFLISRPDIYNIPVLAGNAFTILGLGLWFAAAGRKGRIRIPFLTAGSLCMACAVGCRPQMALFSFISIFIFLFEEKDGKYSFKNRSLLTKGSIPDTICFALPFALIAIPVCWYNQARFGSIFEFGATLSLTTNDMNLRGFNMDRLIRGLYCFLIQPTVTTNDFPYLTSSVVDSAYMGRNLVEFTFGGVLTACPLMLIIPALVFGLFGKLKSEEKAVCLTLLIASFVICVFDVNSAGILYRYTCDFTTGFLIAAFLLWIPLLSEEKDRVLSRRLFTLLLMQALFYSLRVYCADGDRLFIRDCSPVLFERIRSYFT